MGDTDSAKDVLRCLKIWSLVSFISWHLYGFGGHEITFHGVFASQLLGGNLVQQEEYTFLSQKSWNWAPFSGIYWLCDLEQVTLIFLSFECCRDNHLSVSPSPILFEVIDRSLLIESTNEYFYHLFVNIYDYSYLLINEYETLWLFLMTFHVYSQNCLLFLSFIEQ